MLALFCAFFSFVYERFSHGVYSDFMVYLFLLPLLGGVLPFAGIALLKSPYPGRVSRNLYNSGIAALTVGSCMSGVLEIYGTDSPYIPVYWTAGILLAISGTAAYFWAVFHPQRKT
ncbi:hypothetical protein [Papillibacter cinnamivorans]|uniref:Uncharacterized protein n=1 Tax=Papillibacter cinnamivorans DSM 12816 TaxID=1122930 RepID=A0A1W1YDH8_9FIRM|nr:hypothetical protein [Papillibacter cinnamivorans]SMC34184.1 hypothetical protein SAMN02745168_0353 [Papillibacter cinnamivorans DSM 12816]